MKPFVLPAEITTCFPESICARDDLAALDRSQVLKLDALPKRGAHPHSLLVVRLSAPEVELSLHQNREFRQ